jgi:selenide,water dikinase
VGALTSDDAGVYEMRDDCALVQTVDFFTPIVDDPYTYGQIAAANALSDVYAMGGRPVTAMNLLGVPIEKLSPEVIAEILRGGADKVREAGCALIGGHTIKNPEPIFGLAVTGFVHPKKIMTNANGRAGDLLVLTKPLGTGIVTTAIKRGLAADAIVDSALNAMRQLNTAGAEVAEKGFVRCATDVTGYGLLGHLANICRGSNVGAEILRRDVPVLGDEVFDLIKKGCVPGGTRDNLAAAEAIVRWGETPDAWRIVLSDAQTSGGLLLCVAPSELAAVAAILKTHGALAQVIGQLVVQPGIAVI